MPHVRPGACTHARVRDASCQACEDVCAEIAIFPIGSDLHLDAAACSRCGACVAACPQGALDQPDAPPVIATIRARKVAVALCSRHPAAARRPAAPCVHALSLADLAVLMSQGIGRLALATGDCDACDMRPLTTLDDPLARLKALCDTRGLQALRATPATELDEAALLPPEAPANPSRRAVFRPAARLGDLGAIPAHDPATVLAVLQGAGMDAARVFATSPAIDPDTCTGCDACVNICRTGALTITGAPGYGIDPARCDGCRLCVDVCPAGAITLTPLALAAPGVVLTGWPCRACGVPSHAPGPAPADGLCRICRDTGHHKKLFQVLS